MGNAQTRIMQRDDDEEDGWQEAIQRRHLRGAMEGAMGGHPSRSEAQSPVQNAVGTLLEQLQGKTRILNMSHQHLGAPITDDGANGGGDGQSTESAIIAMDLLMDRIQGMHLPHNELILNNNGLRQLPDALSRAFPRLERLAIGTNQLIEIPDSIGDFKSLVWLDFTHNRVSRVSERISELKNLASLGASDCRLTELPSAFVRMPQLKKLGVFNNLITQLPAEIGNMNQLVKLDLSGNQLRTVPAEIGKLTQLTWLNLSNNRIEHLPPEMNQLVKITELGLANNCLRRLPVLDQLHELSLLTVFNNNLEQLDDWICSMPSLAKLDVSGNQLTQLPAKILCMPSLDLLNVRGNRIAEISPPHKRNPFVNPSSLTVLDLRDNRLFHLPLGIRGPLLLELKCSGNPFMALDEEFEDNHQTAKPMLFDLACAYLLKHALHVPKGREAMIQFCPPSIRSTAAAVLNGRAGHWCFNCKELFLHQPIKHVHWEETSDCLMAPFVTSVCSTICKAQRKFSSPVLSMTSIIDTVRLA